VKRRSFFGLLAGTLLAAKTSQATTQVGQGMMTDVYVNGILWADVIVSASPARWVELRIPRKHASYNVWRQIGGGGGWSRIAKRVYAGAVYRDLSMGWGGQYAYRFEPCDTGRELTDGRA